MASNDPSWQPDRKVRLRFGTSSWSRSICSATTRIAVYPLQASRKERASVSIERRSQMTLQETPMPFVIQTAAAFDSFWDSQIGETLTRCLLMREEQRRWVGR